jgi:hypothetical protein
MDSRLRGNDEEGGGPELAIEINIELTTKIRVVLEIAMCVDLKMAIRVGLTIEVRVDLASGMFNSVRCQYRYNIQTGVSTFR